MTSFKPYIVIVVLAAIITWLLIDKFKGGEIAPEGLILRDTVVHYVNVDRVVYQEKIAPPIVRERTDTVYAEKAETQVAVMNLLLRMDSLRSELGKYVTETFEHDTIFAPYADAPEVRDTLAFKLEYYSRNFALDYRFGKRSLPVETKTILLPAQAMNKCNILGIDCDVFYAAIGFFSVGYVVGTYTGSDK